MKRLDIILPPGHLVHPRPEYLAECGARAVARLNSMMNEIARVKATHAWKLKYSTFGRTYLAGLIARDQRSLLGAGASVPNSGSNGV